MTSWFGSKKSSGTGKQPNGSDKQPASENNRITITDTAREKLIKLIGDADSPVAGVRIWAEATSPMNPQYSLAFVPAEEDVSDDTLIDAGDFQIYIDSDSLELIDNVKLDFIQTNMGGGFRIDKIMPKTELQGPLADKVQRVIQDQINPALALHGGFVQLLDVKGNTAYIELGGGCKGCGMVDVTLKQGIEVMIKQNVPEITEILDATDHASGKNPYYQPSK